MKHLSFLLLISIFVINSFNCQSAKLTGTPISSDFNSQNAQNAFDGNLQTEFKSSTQNGWVGLEFSSPVKITQIGWAQKGFDIKIIY